MPLRHPLQQLKLHRLLRRLLHPRGFNHSQDFIEAVKKGDEDAVRKAIASGISLDEADENGDGALPIAAASGCSDIFALLLDAGVSPQEASIPPPSTADLCFFLFRLIKEILKAIALMWLASFFVSSLPLVPSLIFGSTTTLIIATACIAIFTYTLSFVIVYRFYPKACFTTQHILAAFVKFQGNNEDMCVMFLDSDVSLTADEKAKLWSHAIDRGYTGVCQRLLDSGVPVDLRYVHNNYPDVLTGLLHACGASHYEMVLLLLSNDANTTTLDSHSRSCLHMVTRRPYSDHTGSEEDADAILEILLATDAVLHIDLIEKNTDSEVEDVSLIGRYGWAVVEVCQDLRPNALRALLRAGADPNLKSDSGWTALHQASHWQVPQAIELVRALISHDADVNATNENGWTPLGCASSIGKFPEVVRILVEAGADLESTAGSATALQVAARHDICGGEILKYLLQRGADPNVIGGSLGSVLLATLERPYSWISDKHGIIKMEPNSQIQIIDFISEMLKHGLDLSQSTEMRTSAVKTAAQNNLPLVLSFLLEAGAKIPYDAEESQSKISENTNRLTRVTSVLSYLQVNHHEVFEILLKHGVQVDVDILISRDSQEKTVLGEACSFPDAGCLKTTALLLEHGADPNFADMLGYRPIELAARAVSLEHLQKLTKYGASAENNKHGSIFHSLCKGYATLSPIHRNSEKFFNCIRFLKAEIPLASAWRQDSSGKTCMHYLAETADETRLLMKLDGTSQHTASSATPVVKQFLDIFGNPKLSEQSASSLVEAYRQADTDGCTAFHALARRGDVECMRLLVEQNITLASVGYPEAEAKGQAALAFVMLIAQADQRGWNALHHAAAEGRVFACQYLLEMSFAHTSSYLTSDGLSAQDLANEKGHFGIAEYITNFVEDRDRDESEAPKADAVLAKLAQRLLVLEFSEEQLHEAIEAQSIRLRLRNDLT